MYIRMSVRPPLWVSQPGLGPSQPDLRPSQPDLRPSKPDLRPNQPGLRPSQPGLRASQTGLRHCQPGIRLQAWLDGPEWGIDGETDRQAYIRRENLPILQDFVPYWGRCPAFQRKF